MSQNARTRDLEVDSAPRFVWWSTESSVSKGIPSVLAGLEVVIAVAAYWAIAIYFDTFTHLWGSICLAPLLLLRSEQSTTLGVNWFRIYEKGEPIGWISYLVVLTALALISYLLARYWLVGHSGWAAFLRGVIVGSIALQFGIAGAFASGELDLPEKLTLPVALLTAAGTAIVAVSVGAAVAAAGAEAITVAGAVAGVIALAATALRTMAVVRTVAVARGSVKTAATGLALVAAAAILGSSFALGSWMRSIAIRFVATIRYLQAGFFNIPNNFIQNLFVIDFRQPAELVPGYRDTEEYTSDGLIRAFQKEEDFDQKILFGMLFPFFFLPAYAYRLSIKSTCWLYLPLVYIASERDFAFTPEHLLARLGRTPKEWLRRLLALATLAGFIFTTFAAGVGIKPPELLGAKFVSPLEFLFLLDIHSMKPWQVFNLLGAVITLYLFLAAGDVRIDRAYARDKQSQASLARKVQWLKILMRTRNVSSTILILILGIHALLLFSPLASYLPAFILSGLRWFYGEYMPSVP